MKTFGRNSLFLLFVLLSATGLAQTQPQVISVASQEEYQEQLREKAKEAGKSIEVTLRLDSDVIKIPRDTVEVLGKFRAAQAEMGEWLAAWRKLDSEELQRRIREKDGRTKFYCLTMPGQFVSREDAIQKIGPPPESAVKTPQRTKTPSGVLELKNKSDEPQTIYLTWVDGNGAMTYVSGKSLDRGWGFRAGVLEAPHSIELAPGETFDVKVIPDGSIDLFKETGEFEVAVTINSGVKYHYGSGQRLLTKDTIILKSNPVTFRVEYE